jgi:hypothetical protein
MRLRQKTCRLAGLGREFRAKVGDEAHFWHFCGEGGI